MTFGSKTEIGKKGIKVNDNKQLLVGSIKVLVSGLSKPLCSAFLSHCYLFKPISHWFVRRGFGTEMNSPNSSRNYSKRKWNSFDLVSDRMYEERRLVRLGSF